MDRPRIGRSIANQRNRKGVAHGAEPITRLGAYVQPRSPAGARELPGARHGCLQGRGRALGPHFASGKAAISSPGWTRRTFIAAPRTAFTGERKKNSNFLKCQTSKSLERMKRTNKQSV